MIKFFQWLESGHYGLIFMVGFALVVVGAFEILERRRLEAELNRAKAERSRARCTAKGWRRYASALAEDLRTARAELAAERRANDPEEFWRLVNDAELHDIDIDLSEEEAD